MVHLRNAGPYVVTLHNQTSIVVFGKTFRVRMYTKRTCSDEIRFVCFDKKHHHRFLT